jgi:2-haloacid dehalogenase
MTHGISIAACVFDAYGTLFDFRGAVERRAEALVGQAAVLSSRWRDTQLKYTWLRSLQGTYENFERVTADALDFTFDSLGIRNAHLRHELLELYQTVPAFSDVLPMLEQLQRSKVPCLILSNGTQSMLRSSTKAAGLDPFIDGILSADQVGVYKPSGRVYQLAVDALDVPAKQIVFVSANGWDAYGAAAYGFRAVWCNRTGEVHERLPGSIALELRSLKDLHKLLALTR